MKKTILLTGATGSVGFETLRALIKRQEHYAIRIFGLDNPSERKILMPMSNQVEIIWGDLRNPDDVDRAVAGTDIVLHVAAIIPPLADHNPQLAYEVNVGGTKNILAAMQRQVQPPRLIFTSSISVYGDRIDNPIIQVSDPLSPSDGDAYACTKIQAEELVINSGMAWSIFRLCGILTPKLKIQPLMFHMPLETALEWCHRSDAGMALVNAIENETIDGEIFNLGGGKTCQIKARDFIRATLPLYGLNPDVLPEFAFATKNFHSGYYLDSHKLNDLLHFQRTSLSDYFSDMRKSISPFQKALFKTIPKGLIQKYLLGMSEPLRAIRDNNQNMITRFYGSREAFERLLPQQFKKDFSLT